jgi:hypothetical protein
MKPEIFAGLTSARHKPKRIHAPPAARLSASLGFCKLDATGKWRICDDAAASRILTAAS